MDRSEAVQILVGDRGVWSGTPWDYSSLRFMKFETESTGEMWYGYGQTIYADIKFDWDIVEGNVLRIRYHEPIKSRLQPDFVLPDSEKIRLLEFQLTAGDVKGLESILAQPYHFRWTLALATDPWPDSLDVPHDRPKTFYGYRQ